MRINLRWIQMVLLILLAHTRLSASSKREEALPPAEGTNERIDLANKFNLWADFPDLPGIKPQFSKSHKNRNGAAHTESDEAEKDYAYERFNPNNHLRNRSLAITFGRITEKAKGKLFTIIPMDVPETVNSLIKEKAQPNTDLVFLVDQTGSMQDDVARIQWEVGKTLDEYKDTPNFRVGAATYSG